MYLEEYRSVDYMLDNIIVAECHKSLNEIEFVDANSFNMHNIDKSFENVRTVMFVTSRCCHLIWNFNKWFPNAHTLYFQQQRSVRFQDRRMLEQHFPALKHFGFGNMEDEEKSSKWEDYKKLNNYNITMFIHMNPQLKSLFIFFERYKLMPNIDGINWNYEIFEAIHSKLTGLEGFHVQVGLDSHEVDIPKFHFGQLKNLTIKSSNIYEKGAELKLNAYEKM